MADILMTEKTEVSSDYPSYGFHAMDVRVIANHVASYLSFQDIHRCALVSKQWNENFEPILWRHPTSMPDWHERQGRITEATVERNAKYIESLRVANTTLHYKSLVKHTTHLKQLAIHFLDPHHKFPVIDKVRLIQRNKGIQRLVLIQGWFNWANITPDSHRYLKHLVLRNCRIERNYTKPFWELMTHIETIELILTAVPAPDFKPSEWSFTNLRCISMSKLPKLRRWHMRGGMLCDWIGRCPNLYKLKLQLEPNEPYTIPGKKLAQAIHQNKIPLRAFELSSLCRITENDMASLISTVDGLQELKATRWMALGERASDLLLSRHANTLTRICLRQARQTTEDQRPIHIPSSYLQKLLSSCPNLEEFYGLTMQASDMLSSPWVCSKLRVLVIFIQASNAQDSYTLNQQLWNNDGSRHIQEGLQEGKRHKGNNRYCRKRCNDEIVRNSILEHSRIYDKLSRLSHLEELDLSLPATAAYGVSTHLSMRFICGFGKLGRLRKLRVFGMCSLDVRRGPTTCEMNWMVGWKQPHNVSGDPKQEAQVIRRNQLIDAQHRPWPRLEQLRWNAQGSIYGHQNVGNILSSRWLNGLPKSCKRFESNCSVLHTSEEYVWCDDWDVIEVGPEPEPPLTDSESQGNQ